MVGRFGVVLALAALGHWMVLAEPVPSDLASAAVGNWLACRAQLGCKLGRSVCDVRTCTTNGASFHVVRLSGGGFVVTSSDTEVEPILAFSSSGDLDENVSNPLWVMLCRDVPARSLVLQKVHASAQTASAAVPRSATAAKWARLLPQPATNGLLRLTHASSGLETVSDIRRAPLLETQWNQMQDSLYSNMGDPCYNYYTPDHDPCGCVATATAQIMRFHRYPTDSVTPGTYTCKVMTGKDWIVEGYSYYPIYETLVLTMQGGYYDWDSMPAIPANGTTLAQRQAIGKLTSDVGIACQMKYGEDSSGAGDYMAAKALTERFLYANAIAAVSSSLNMSSVRAAIIPNLDARLPVLLGVSDGYYTGHAIVADGYGYSYSTLYVHFNQGWGGVNDAWYAPPDISDYSSVDSMVYNIYPTGVANGVICSGRVLSSASGSPVSGVLVTAVGSDTSQTATTDESGIYAFILEPGAYSLTALDVTNSVTLVANVGTPIHEGGYYSASPAPQVNNRYDCNLLVTVSDPEPDPTPTPDPEPDPTPTPDPEPDPTPMPDPEPDPTPTPDPEPDPTPTPDPEPDPTPTPLSAIEAATFAGATYDGYLRLTDGTIVGTIQVKATKTQTNKKTNKTVSKLTIKIQTTSESKAISISGEYDLTAGGEQTFSKNGRSVALFLGSDGLTGSFEGAPIVGVPNVFVAKDAASKAAASAAEAAYVGTYNLIAREGVFTITVAKKGKVKVSGTTTAGQKLSVSTSLLVGSDVACAVVLAPKLDLAFTIWFGDKTTVDGFTDAVVGAPGTLASGAEFRLAGGALAALVGDDTYAAYFPTALPITVSGTSWQLPKAGKVVLNKAKTGVDETKLGENPSALKLSYTAKTGAFKGSFKAYVNNKGKPKAVTVSVTGVLVDGVGYGWATVKKAGSVTVTICQP